MMKIFTTEILKLSIVLDFWLVAKKYKQQKHAQKIDKELMPVALQPAKAWKNKKITRLKKEVEAFLID